MCTDNAAYAVFMVYIILCHISVFLGDEDASGPDLPKLPEHLSEHERNPLAFNPEVGTGTCIQWNLVSDHLCQFT
jgi:hypothetical protein